MEGLNYARRRDDDDDDGPLQESTGSKLSFGDADADPAKDQADPNSDGDERLRDPDLDRNQTKDAASDREITSDSVAANFGRTEKPDLGDGQALKDHLQTSWDDFQALQGRTAHDTQGIKQFHHAAVYAHANPVLAGTQQQGPLDYLKDQPSYQGGSGNEALAHSSVAYQNLLITETGRLWGHADPNLERGANAVPRIAERLEAGSRHILGYTLDNAGHGSPNLNTETLSWNNTKEQNGYFVQQLTNDFTDMDALDRLADGFTTAAYEKSKPGHKATFRDDEAGLLYATGSSAHSELLRDRTELRNLAYDIRREGINGTNSQETLDRINDIAVHMDYTAGLHAYTQEKLGEILDEETRQADYEGSIRQRIESLFGSLRERLFGDGEDLSDQAIGPGSTGGTAQAEGQPGQRHQAQLDYPAADPLDQSSSLTELTALAFDRVNDQDRGQEVDDNMQALWKMMKSPRGDGDFWQAAAYGSANRDLADPQGLGLDGYMAFRPQFAVVAQNAEQRADELMSDTYRENIKLLYSEPEGTWQPGDRDENGLLTFNQIHRTLYASEEHMREFNQQYLADTGGIKGLIDWTDDLYQRERMIDYVTDLKSSPENLLEYNAKVTAELQEPASHPDRETLENRDDEPGLLFHTGVLASIQYAKANEDLQSAVETLTDPATAGDDLTNAWQKATNTMTRLDYLRGLQKYVTEQLNDHLAQEQAAQEEEAQHRSIIGRVRSLFGAEDRIKQPVA